MFGYSTPALQKLVMRLVSQCALATRCERNGDARFSGFGFDYGGMAGASLSHPPPFDSPPPANP